MTDLLLAPWLNVAQCAIRHIPSVGMSMPEFDGPVRTMERGGNRLQASLEYTPVGYMTATLARELRQLVAFLVRAGAGNRVYLTDPGRRPEGTFLPAELITDNTFASGGLSAWTQGSEYSGVVYDRQARLTRNAVTATARALYRTTAQMPALTQYAPYVFRSHVYKGRGNIAGNLQLRAGSTNGGDEYGRADFTGPGLLTFGFVTLGTAISLTLLDDSSSGVLAGDFLDVPYTSCARCALVDAAPNELQHSNAIDQSPWASARSSVTANQANGPDGALTMDSLNEDTNNGTHYRTQVVTKAAEAQDWTGRAYVKASTRSEVRIQIGESGGNFAVFTISLSDGSVVNAASASGTVTNARGAVVNKGNGVYEIFLTARIPSSITTTNAILVMPSVAGSASYTGAGTNSAIYVGGTSYARSQLPHEPTETTTTPMPNGVAPTGRSMSLKGLPANATLMAEAPFEVRTTIDGEVMSEYKILTAPMIADAAGRAHVQFEPPLRGDVADNAVVIFHEPFGYFVSADEGTGFARNGKMTLGDPAQFIEA